MPLVVVTVSESGGKDWRSRPGLNPPVFAGGIALEGLGDALQLLDVLSRTA